MNPASETHALFFAANEGDSVALSKQLPSRRQTPDKGHTNFPVIDRQRERRSRPLLAVRLGVGERPRWAAILKVPLPATQHMEGGSGDRTTGRNVAMPAESPINDCLYGGAGGIHSDLLNTYLF